jgi:catechol 2,3-dioxygenase-like lactoylglutathione lyase family enzyme
MIDTKTYGLTHIAIAVKNTERTLKFYQQVFDVQVMYHQQGFLQVQTPGSNDIIVFEEKQGAPIGETGGIAHFGFRLKDPSDIDEMSNRVQQAGGKILDKGEFIPGEPYLFFKDPDGYEVEIWYEIVE